MFRCNLNRWLNNSVLGFIVLVCIFASFVIFKNNTIDTEAADIFVSENFSRSTTSGWKFGKSTTSDNPCLTAANLGSSSSGSLPGCPTNTTNASTLPESNGVLRLTPAKNNQATFVYYDTQLPSNRGLTFNMDVYAYGSGNANNDADGFSFILFDGTATPTTGGGYGGSLGYAKRSGINGFEKGYVGIGFDSFGNFANDNEGRGGGGCPTGVAKSGRVLNSITMRGSGNAQTGYCYLKGTDSLTNTLGRVSFPTQTTRISSIKRKLKITLSPTNVINVAVDFGSGFVDVITDYNLNTAPNQATLPSSLKFGFAASTGGQYNIHEVDSISVTSTPPDLIATTSVPSGSLTTQGGNAQVTVAIANEASAGYANQVTNVNVEFPAGITPVSANGTDWNSQINSQVVDANYTKPISPGQSLPNLNIIVVVNEVVDSPSVIVKVQNSDESTSESISNNVNTYNPTTGNRYSALTETNTNCSQGGRTVESVDSSSITVLQLCLNSGNLSIFAGDYNDNNDICSSEDITNQSVVDAVSELGQIETINCQPIEDTISLSTIYIRKDRQNTTAIIDDIILEDLRGLSLVNYTLSATIDDLETSSGQKITLGTRPDGYSTDSDVDAPSGANAGKIFATINCSSSTLQILLPSSAVQAGTDNYQRGSSTTLVSTFAPATLFYTTNAVTPSRIDLDNCLLKYRIPAYVIAGDYTTKITYTVT